MRPVEIVTANLDFALSAEAVDNDLKNIEPKAEIIAFQEGKNVNVDRLLNNPTWKVYQALRDDAKQGTGIAWRNGRIRAGKRGRRIGTRPHGRGIQTRYITWITLSIKDDEGKEHPLTVASVHLPPKRFWGLIYNIMIRSILVFAKGRRKPTILCGDWNKLIHRAPDLKDLARGVNGEFYGFGIDGFLLISKGKWKVVETKELPKNSKNGHHPIQIKLLPKKR